MYVGAGNAVNNDKTSDVDLFTDLEDHLFQLIVYGDIGAKIFCGKKCIDIRRILGNDGLEKSLNKLTEGSVLCNEVGLAVDLDHSGNIAVLKYLNDTVCGNSAFLFGGNCKSSFTKDLESLFHIALCLNKGLFALHHTDTGLCTEGGNIFCGNSSHFISPYLV